MIFDTDADKIGIAFHNLTQSKLLEGASWIPNLPTTNGGTGGPDNAESVPLLTVLIIIIVCLLAILILIIGNYSYFSLPSYSCRTWHSIPEVILKA